MLETSYFMIFFFSHHSVLKNEITQVQGLRDLENTIDRLVTIDFSPLHTPVSSQ